MNHAAEQTTSELTNKDIIPKQVGLIVPPSVFLLDERVFPNLGILKVAAVLEREGIRVDMLDLSGISNFEEALQSYLAATPVKHIGITTTTPQLPATMKVIAAIRRLRPDIRIILGGPHVTLISSALKFEKKSGVTMRGHKLFDELIGLVDVLVSGDGEMAIFKAFLPDSPGLIDADDMQSGLFMNHASYDASPWPARHLIDMSSYRYMIEDHKSTSLIGQLGCPFACGFCGGRFSNSLRKIRTRTTDNILAQLEYLHTTFGFTGFMFYDDELNVNKEIVSLMKGITKLQKKLGAEFRLRGFVKSELFTQDQAHAMYEAGFRWLLSGFESGAPRVLKNMNKKATREDNTNTVKLAHEAGLKIKALMSIGHPGESPETVTETRDWLLEVKPDDFDCTIITTYPGTPYFDEAKPHESMKGIYTYTYAPTGDRLHAYDLDYMTTADYYKGDPDGGYKAFVFTDYLSADDLVKMRDDIERSVRGKLAIPFNPSRSSILYDHSMGMGRELPTFILRSSNKS